MIDPLHSLAFSVQANPGVFAILLGSGVSRSAHIPTGWEITIDLVKKLAGVVGEECGTDPSAWYQNRYQKAPDYSDILDELAKTAAERQQLIRSYLEPTDPERSEGKKSPTAAHKAIASLVAKGYVRVIITTNFDRLIETALSDVGVVATVLSSQDQVQGAMPLIHTRCCVIKLHGDYLDTRIRNTSAELESYPDEFNELLGRILEDFGLVVCGWSAEWDPALRSAIERSVTRRFSHYWAIRGNPGVAAQRLISHRQAQHIAITDAEAFFSELERLVIALEQFSRPHPLSVEAAVASLKGYIAESKNRIRLEDLVTGEVARVIKKTSDPAFSVDGGPAPSKVTFNIRIRSYEASTELLLSMAIWGGYWVDEWHFPTWLSAIRRLAEHKMTGGFALWVGLQNYPATLLLYALGLGAVEAGDRGLSFLGKIFSCVIQSNEGKDEPAVEILPLVCLLERSEAQGQWLDGMEKRRAPFNDWLHNLLKQHSSSLFLSEQRFTYIFDKLEILIALNYRFSAKHKRDWYWVPTGCFGYRRDNLSRIISELRLSIESEKDASPYVVNRIIGMSAEDSLNELEGLSKWVRELRWY